MKIAIATSQTPFVQGDSELLAGRLRDKLEQYGHRAEIVRIPLRWNPLEAVIDHMLVARLMRLVAAERVVALRFPAYYVSHADKVLWLVRQRRRVDDLWEAPYRHIADTPAGRRVRAAVVDSDRRFLTEARRIYAGSKAVSERLRGYCGLRSNILRAPLADSTPFHCDAYGDYFFLPGPVGTSAHWLAAVDAMADARSAARLIIAGRPATSADLRTMMALVRENALERRIEIIPRSITDEERVRLLAGARAVVYLPSSDEAHGYETTLRSFYSRKPVITLTDAGDTLEIVQHGVNGVVAGDVRELCDAMDDLIDDPGLAERLGGAGLDTIERLDISWDRVIGCLTGR